MRLMLLIVIFTIGIPVTAANASHIIVQYADTIWETTPEHSSNLMDVTSDVPPRVTAAYANSIFQSYVYLDDMVSNLVTGVPPRIIAEYAESILTLDMTPPTFVDLNHPPVAKAGDNITASIDSLITFDGSSSYDPDGHIISYQWDFGEGNIANGKIIFHNYAKTGTYTVTLQVTDNQGATDTDTLLVQVLEHFEEEPSEEEPSEKQSPVIISMYAEKEIATPGEIIVIHAVAIHPEDDLLTFNWYCDGGIIYSIGNKASWQAPHYEGMFYIDLKVSDSHGNTQPKTISINVSVDAPVQTGLYLGLYSTQTEFLKVGDEVPIEFSVQNPITSNDTLIAQLTLKVPSGWSLTSSDMESSGGGLATSNVYEIEPGRSKRIIAHLKSNQPGLASIEGHCDFYFRQEEENKHKQDIFLVLNASVEDKTDGFWEYREDDPDETPGLTLFLMLLGLVVCIIVWKKQKRKNR